jgi:hypothetical protein
LPARGKDNFAADREAAARLLEAAPSAALVVRENWAFLARAVRFLAREAGICQFLDIGTGLPTLGRVHEIGPGWPGSRRAVGFRLLGTDEAGPVQALSPSLPSPGHSVAMPALNRSACRARITSWPRQLCPQPSCACGQKLLATPEPGSDELRQVVRACSRKHFGTQANVW